jgi:hypothetical protein
MQKVKLPEPRQADITTSMTPGMRVAGVSALISAVDGCSTLEGFAGQAEWIVDAVYEAIVSSGPSRQGAQVSLRRK